MKYASFGSVSSGTMLTTDLLSAFTRELEYQLGQQSTRFKRAPYRKLINDTKRCLSAYDEATDSLPAESDFLINEFFDVLSEFAPPYAYFGAVEGDGADYGYWLSSGFVEDFDGLKVNDLSEVPANYRGEVLHVTDHGNVSLYVAGSRGKLREIWAVV